MADPGTPLITYGQFTESAYGDLVSAGQDDAWPEPAVNDILLEATRLVEEEAGGRRLAPFTITETHRASASDPDQYGDGSSLPLPIQGAIGWDYAQSLGASKLVRECWVDHFPAHYPDMWTYSNVSVTTILTYGGTPQPLGPARILDGPDNTGHLWFQLGVFLPVGSRIRVTYSGGYSTVPASLVRACKFMAAYLVVRELDPKDSSHDPDELHTDALLAISNWERA